jgi:hypothetical protein
LKLECENFGFKGMSNDGEEKKEGGLIGKIALGVLIPLLIGGTVPWWWDKIFPPGPTPPPTIIVDPSPSSPLALVSRNFFIGRWQVQQAFGQISGQTVIDYFNDGSFESEETQFINGQGQKVKSMGRWEFNELSAQSFSLRLEFNDGRQWQGKFKIIDQNRIQNIDQNYIAIRIN